MPPPSPATHTPSTEFRPRQFRSAVNAPVRASSRTSQPSARASSLITREAFIQGRGRRVRRGTGGEDESARAEYEPSRRGRGVQAVRCGASLRPRLVEHADRGLVDAAEQVAPRPVLGIERRLVHVEGFRRLLEVLPAGTAPVDGEDDVDPGVRGREGGREPGGAGPDDGEVGVELLVGREAGRAVGPEPFFEPCRHRVDRDVEAGHHLLRAREPAVAPADRHRALAADAHAAEDAPCAGGARGPAREVPRRDERGRDALSAAGKDRRAFVRDGGVLGGPADAGLAHPQRRACAVGGRPRPGPRHRSAGRAPRSEARASSDEAHRSGCLARYARQVVAHRSGSSRPLPSTRCVTWWCGALRTTSGDS